MGPEEPWFIGASADFATADTVCFEGVSFVFEEEEEEDLAAGDAVVSLVSAASVSVVPGLDSCASAVAPPEGARRAFPSLLLSTVFLPPAVDAGGGEEEEEEEGGGAASEERGDVGPEEIGDVTGGEEAPVSVVATDLRFKVGNRDGFGGRTGG